MPKKFTGIYYHKGSGKWHLYIKVDGVPEFQGSFKSELAAKQAKTRIINRITLPDDALARVERRQSEAEKIDKRVVGIEPKRGFFSKIFGR